LAALGETHLPSDAPGTEVVRVEDPARGRYGKLVLRQDRIAGAILLGLPDAAATIVRLYDRQASAPDDRVALLLGRTLSGDAAAGRSPAELPGAAVVCHCNGVSKDALVTAWRQGARQASDLTAATRAATGCGGCLHELKSLTAWLGSSVPVDARHGAEDTTP